MKKLVLGLTLLTSLSSIATELVMKERYFFFEGLKETTYVICGNLGELELPVHDICSLNGTLPVCGATRIENLSLADEIVIKPEERVFVTCQN